MYLEIGVGIKSLLLMRNLGVDPRRNASTQVGQP